MGRFCEESSRQMIAIGPLGMTYSLQRRFDQEVMGITFTIGKDTIKNK